MVAGFLVATGLRIPIRTKPMSQSTESMWCDNSIGIIKPCISTRLKFVNILLHIFTERFKNMKFYFKLEESLYNIYSIS